MKQARLVFLAIVIVGIPAYGYFFAQANRSVVALDLLATRVSELSLWLVVWGAFTAGILTAALVSLWAFARLGGTHLQVRRELARTRKQSTSTENA
ncbi:MAG: LapA family protein [bacterium]|nr:LapA family protein [bacterium]